VQSSNVKDNGGGIELDSQSYQRERQRQQLDEKAVQTRRSTVVVQNKSESFYFSLFLLSVVSLFSNFPFSVYILFKYSSFSGNVPF